MITTTRRHAMIGTISAGLASTLAACNGPSAPLSKCTNQNVQKPDRSTPARKWAHENVRGLLNLFLPTFRPDGITLDEDAIRHDVNHAIAHGFSGTLPMINWTMPHDPRWEQLHRIIVDEAKGRLPLHGIVFGRDADEDITIIKRLEKIGVEMILLASTHSSTITNRELYDSFAKRINATNLPIMLYAALSKSRNFPALGPAGQPLDVFNRLADLPNTCAVKISQPVSLISTTQICERLADRLLIGPVNLDFAPALARQFHIQWSGQWNGEAIQTPQQQIGNQFLAACAAQDFDAVNALSLRLQPVLDQFFDLQASVIKSGAHPWQHNKYYSWIGGGNGGILPNDPHAPKGSIPVLDAKEREKIHQAFAKSGLQLPPNDTNQFVVGRTGWQSGSRAKDLVAIPQYQP